MQRNKCKTKKMELKIDVHSKQIIKPSVPTPDHLQYYQLSFLDQITVPVYNPLIIFYPENGDTNLTNHERSDKVKQSLSEVLTHFYPLSGRIKDNLHVDCNDEGIPYLEAHVNCELSHLIEHPNPDELRKLIPFELDGVQEVPLGVQFNIFKCGGVAITLGLSHKLGDALSTLYFVKFWAAMTRGVSELPHPLFNSATIFPPINLSGFNPSSGITKQKIVAKRFLFKTSSVEAIRTKYTVDASLENQKPSSRIEALSVFMYTRFMSSTNRDSSNKIYFMLHAVNLRTRMEPQLPECSFGNYYRVAITFPKPGDDGFGLVKQVRDSIKSIDREYVKNLKDGNQHLEYLKKTAESFARGEFVSLNFTSLCNFPLYEADFGWGKPLWVGSPSLTFNSLVIFMDSATGDGIEALVHLAEEDMNKFEGDEELLEFVAPYTGSIKVHISTCDQ